MYISLVSYLPWDIAVFAFARTWNSFSVLKSDESPGNDVRRAAPAFHPKNAQVAEW